MIIGLIGHKRVGKSTVADRIEKVHGYHRVNMKDALIKEINENFPELLKVIARDTFGLDVAVDERKYIDKLFGEKPPLMRTLLQNYGTNVRRGDDVGYWIDKWGESVLDMDNVVVDDIRFENEADIIRESFGVIVRVVRSDVRNTDSHVSETEHLDIDEDYTLTITAGDFDKQDEMVDELLSTIRENYDL